jgi:ribulose-phosphate 3-epimerase
MLEILPSLLAADFAHLDRDIAFAEQAGVSKLHLDIMDGHFVPNISFGPPVVRCIRAITDLHLDVHLMIEDPDRYLHAFAKAGANSMSVHVEACRHLHRTLRAIQGEGALAGVVINPATPVAALEDVLDVADYVLIMSVNPGFGGQQFIPKSLLKVMELERRRREAGLRFPIQIDGGISTKNIGDVARAGVDWVVAGSSIYANDDPPNVIRQMQQSAREATAVRV